MKPISEFPFEGPIAEAHPMHGRMLLLKTHANVGRHFALGHYDAINDVFHVSASGHQPTGNYFDEVCAVGNELDHRELKKHKLRSAYSDFICVMPKAYLLKKGSRRITEYMVLEDVLDFIAEHDLTRSDIGAILDVSKIRYFVPYLVCTKDRRLFIADIGGFVEPAGTQFSAFAMTTVKGNPMCVNSPVPREIIRYVINLEELDDLI